MQVPANKAVSNAVQGAVSLVKDAEELVQDVQAKDVAKAAEAAVKTAVDVATEVSALSFIRWPCCRRKKAAPAVPESLPAPPPALSLRTTSK